MFNFLKENSYTIVKMVINQIGLTVFGLVLAVATSSNETLLKLTSVFSVCFYLFLLYSMTWEMGAKDKIRVDAGRAKAKPFTGALISLCANSINILMGILICIGRWSMVSNTEPLWAVNLFGVTNAIARFFEAMYLGLIQCYSPNNPIAFLLIPLPAIFISGLGYFIGLKNRKMLSAIGISPKK